MRWAHFSAAQPEPNASIYLGSVSSITARTIFLIILLRLQGEERRAGGEELCDVPLG